MFQVNETSPISHLIYGRQSVGQAAVQLTIVSRVCNRGVLIRAPGLGETDANDDIVYVGNANVTTDNGFPITPGAAIELPIDDPSQIYVVSPSNGQSVAWIGV